MPNKDPLADLYDDEEEEIEDPLADLYDDEEDDEEIADVPGEQKKIDAEWDEAAGFFPSAKDVINFPMRAAEAAVPFAGPMMARAGTEFGNWLSGEKKDAEGKTEEWPTYDEERARYTRTNPKMSMAADMAGASIGPSSIGAASRVLQTAKGAGGVKRFAAGVGNTAAAGLAGGAEVAADAWARGDVDVNKAAEMAGGLTALLTGLAKFSPGFYQKIIAGIPDEIIEKYRANPNAVNKADTEKFIRDVMEDIENQGDRLKHAQEDVHLARDSVNKAERYQKEDMKTVHQGSAEELKRAQEMHFAKLKSEDIPQGLPEEIIEDMKELRGIVSAGSSKAFGVLEKTGTTVNTAPARRASVVMVKRLRPKKEMVRQADGTMKEVDKFQTGEEKRRLAAMEELYKKVKSLGDNANPVEVKEYLQLLDSATESSYLKKASGDFVPVESKNLLAIRGALDSELKKIEAYRLAMEPVSRHTNLLSRLNKRFKEPQAVGKSLRSINKYDSRVNKKDLKELEELLGKSYEEQLGPYFKAQERLKPEKKWKETSSLSRYRKLKNLEKQQAFQKENLAPRENANLQKLEEDLSFVTDDSKYLKDLSDPIAKVGRLTGKGKTPTFPITDAFKKLQQKTGKDYLAEIENIAIQRAFNTPFVRGGRNVYVSTFSVAGLMGLMFQAAGRDSRTGEMMGSMFGSMMGAAADIDGPTWVKFFIDIDKQPSLKHLVKPLINAYRKSPKAAAEVIAGEYNQNDNFRKYIIEQKNKDLLRIEGKNKR